jgi:surface antigen
MKSKLFIYLALIAVIIATSTAAVVSHQKAQPKLAVGDTIDSFNQVKVYYNRSIGNVSGRNVVNGYNLGLKYQCVEFVKRYYYEYYHHKMPNSYGHAKDFFRKGLKDGSINADRDLIQFTNPSKTKPKVDDLVVFDGNTFNQYGHVAIVSKVDSNFIEIIQQNVGTRTRETMVLQSTNGFWTIKHSGILGWLRTK